MTFQGTNDEEKIFKNTQTIRNQDSNTILQACKLEVWTML